LTKDVRKITADHIVMSFLQDGGTGGGKCWEKKPPTQTTTFPLCHLIALEEVIKKEGDVRGLTNRMYLIGKKEKRRMEREIIHKRNSREAELSDNGHPKSRL